MINLINTKLKIVLFYIPTLSIFIKGLSSGNGSGVITSRPAPPILFSCNATMSASWSINPENHNNDICSRVINLIINF